MDPDIYHLLTWLLAVGLPIVGWFITKSALAIPGLLPSFLVLAMSAQHAGLAVLRPVPNDTRYMFGGIMFALGLLIWVITINAFSQKGEREKNN